MHNNLKPRLLVATRNAGKGAEYAALLEDLGAAVVSLDDIQCDLDVEEIGFTFEENAAIKALAYADASGLLTLADDSGLEVDALGGSPGVKTARYGGEGLNPKQRYERLLENMADVPKEMRGARFRCVVALARPGQLVMTSSGSCEGEIAFAPSGTQGFGYDPVFYLPDRKQTMAELAPEEKHKISHRGRAVKGIIPRLKQELEQPTPGSSHS